MRMPTANEFREISLIFRAYILRLADAAKALASANEPDATDLRRRIKDLTELMRPSKFGNPETLPETLKVEWDRVFPYTVDAVIQDPLFQPVWELRHGEGVVPDWKPIAGLLGHDIAVLNELTISSNASDDQVIALTKSFTDLMASTWTEPETRAKRYPMLQAVVEAQLNGELEKDVVGSEQS